MIDRDIFIEVNKVVHLLYEKKYDELFHSLSSSRISISEFINELSYYNLNIGYYPDKIEKIVDIVKIDGYERKYSVNIDLIDIYGVVSDVTLELTINLEESNSIELDGIHVL